MKLKVSVLFFILMMPVYSVFTLPSHTSGRYSEDFYLDWEKKQEVFYSFSSQDPENFIPFDEPLHLTALTGEERRYSIWVREGLDDIKHYEFIIDKKKPSVPEFSHQEGLYLHDVDISFKSDKNERIMYAVNSSVLNQPRYWDGRSFRLSVFAGRSKSFVIQAYSVDLAGNKSDVLYKNLIIDKTRVYSESSISLLSPGPGEYANEQPLVVDSVNIKNLVYTLDGSDPMLKGIPYEGSVRLSVPGRYHIRVAGRSTLDGSLISRERTYSYVNGHRIDTTIDSGKYTGSVILKVRNPESEVYYNFSDTVPDETSLKYSKGIKLAALEGTRRYSVLTLRAFHDEKWSLPQRYLLDLDFRKGDIPVPYSQVIGNRNIVRFRKHPDSRVYYSIDTELKKGNSLSYSSPVVLESKDNSDTAVLYYSQQWPDGSSSKTGRQTFKTSYTGFELNKDHISVKKESSGMVSLDSRLISSGRLKYYIHDEGETAPDLGRLNTMEKPLGFYLPFGDMRTFTVSFINEDDYGFFSRPLTLDFRIDRQGPPVPGFDVKGEHISILSESGVFYRVFVNGRASGTEFLPYEEPVRLNASEGNLNEFYLESYAVDSLGNRSNIVKSPTVKSDKRVPFIKKLRGISEGDVVNSPVVSLKFDEVSQDTKIYYSVTTDGSEPADPRVTRQIMESFLTLETPENREIQYRIKFLPFQINHWGEMKELSFTVDRIKPSAALINGVERGGLYNDKRFITINSGNSDNTIFYIIKKSSDWTGLERAESMEGTLYTRPVELDSARGEEINYSLLYTVLDSAGNSFSPEVPLQFTIDRQIPFPPVLTGIPVNRFSSLPVSLAFDFPEAGKIFYNISVDGSRPDIPDTESAEYKDHIALQGYRNKTVLYKIQAVFQDLAGNLSMPGFTEYITVDREKPGTAPEPLISGTGADSNLLRWEVPEDLSLYYRFNYSGISSQESFRKFKDPLELRITGDSIRVEYYLEDRAGNKGPLKSEFLHLLKNPFTPGIRGARNNAVYTEGVSLNALSDDGVIRYEVGFNGDIPEEVTQFSPLMKGSLLVNPALGEDVEYSFSFKSFKDTDSWISSPASKITFRIDKKPPEAPVVSGISNGGFYSSGTKLVLDSEAEKVFYRIRGKDDPAPGDFIDYKEPVVLNFSSGTFQHYVIETFSVDENGNRSRILDKDFVIDNRVVYVSSERGNDYYNGTRDKPFKTLRKAIEKIGMSSRDTIYLDRGLYYLQSTLTSDRSLFIRGGLNSDTWEKEEETDISHIVPGRYFPQDTSLFKSHSHGISLDSIKVTDPTGRSGIVFQNENSALSLIDCLFEMEKDSSSTFLFQRGGQVNISNTTIKMSAPDLVLMNTYNTDVNISRSQLSGDSEKSTMIARISGGGWQISESSIILNKGQYTMGFQMNNTRFVLSQTKLNGGKGRLNSELFTLKNSDVEISDSYLESPEEAHIFVGFRSVKSRISMTMSRVEMNSSYGSTLFLNSQDTLELKGNLIKGKGQSVFNQIMDSTSSHVNCYNNIIQFTGKNHGSVFLLKNTAGEMLHNSVLVNSGEESGAMAVSSDSRARSQLIIANNLFLNTVREGTMVVIEKGSPDVLLKNNLFMNWKNGYREFNLQCRDTEALNLIDGIPFSGPFHGNIMTEYTPGTMTSVMGTPYPSESFPGIDMGSPEYSIPEDWAGQTRPNPSDKIKPLPDAGAVEWYR